MYYIRLLFNSKRLSDSVKHGILLLLFLFFYSFSQKLALGLQEGDV